MVPLQMSAWKLHQTVRPLYNGTLKMGSFQVDGFVVKYMHEPGGRSDTERWTARTVMSPTSRHLEVPNLTAHKPYAFCVLAIKNNRQGACSDPPTLLERLTPTYMVQNLVVEWKTSNSVKLKWDYNGPVHVGFYLNHTGKKEYFDHTLAMKSMTTPGFKHELDESSREYLWTNLRPYMQYTFHVGVRTLPPGARQYWPKEVVIVTDPTGPPFVFPPELDEVISNGIGSRPGQVVVRLRPASEEYGPISHYWLIIVPGNFSKDDVVNMGSAELEAATIARRKALGKQLTDDVVNMGSAELEAATIARRKALGKQLTVSPTKKVGFSVRPI
ncbi:unnamed protein product [Haemonchus placei]|uniref:Fibronectin type-III domain-containing protein n=1 Tax=Haemonchus placei TaxID=6290 RepID=A0A3P7ZAT3_HAEPC|nr:unnamed protein product [Haemonchus placei]